MLADAQQKLTSAKGHADVGLEIQAKELLAQERTKHTDANAAGLSGQTVVQAEDRLVTKPGDMPFNYVSNDNNMAENAADPLVPNDGSSIINEGTQGEVVTYRRVQGGDGYNSSQARISVNAQTAPFRLVKKALI